MKSTLPFLPALFLLHPCLDAQGSLAVRLVPEVVAACQTDVTDGKGAKVFEPEPNDIVAVQASAITLAAETGTTAMALWHDSPADLFFTGDVSLDAGATLTVLLRGNRQEKHPGRAQLSPLDDSYALTLDAHAQQVTLRRQNAWNRRPAMRVQTLQLPTERSFRFHLMLHGDVLEAFVDDRISLCARLQNPSGSLGILARDGKATLTNLRIARLP
jgi:hypothetical protein